MKVKLISYYKNDPNSCAKCCVVHVPEIIKLNESDYENRHRILDEKIKKFQEELTFTSVKSKIVTYKIFQSKMNEIL
jgi:uncharacterized protein with ATP-grasp and redox domains